MSTESALGGIHMSSQPAKDGSPAVARVSRERLQSETEIYSDTRNPERSRGFITRIPVDEFLKLTTRNDQLMDRIKSESPRFDPAHFDNDEYLLPSLTVYPIEGKIVDHEGRHRAASLMASGAIDIPVVIKTINAHESLGPISLKGQFGRGSYEVKQMVALTTKNEDEALRMANPSEAAKSLNNLATKAFEQGNPMDMKERLVVSNGSKRVERADDKGQWEAYKVEDKGNLKNGVYQLHQARSIKPDSKGQYEGTIIHADKNSVYQDLGDKGLARFDRHAFAQAPEIGRFTTVQYEYGRARIDDGKALAGAHAATAAIDKQVNADGLNAQQRAIIAARVQQNLQNSIALGKVPEVKIKEEVQIPREAKKEQEHSR